MSSPDDSYKSSNQHTSASGRRRRQPDPAWSNRDFWVQTTAIRLPYLDLEVPLLISSTGHHVVPVAPLCRALHIDATTAIRRSQHRLLWHGAELLPLQFPQGGRKPPLTAFAWCLDYPLSIGYWLGSVYSMVKDPHQRLQIHRFADAAGDLSVRAFDVVHEQYETGRQGMFALATTTSRLQELYGHLRSRLENDESTALLSVDATTHSLERNLPLAQWLARTGPFLDQTQIFLRSWSEHQSHQLVTDVVQIDEHGQVIGDIKSTAPFAVFTDEQQKRLKQAEADCVQLLREGETFKKEGYA